MKYDCGFTKENKWFRYRAAAIIIGMRARRYKPMLYKVMFYYQSKPVCVTLQRAATPDDAALMAEFRLIALYPNVSYDNVKAFESEC